MIYKFHKFMQNDKVSVPLMLLAIYFMFFHHLKDTNPWITTFVGLIYFYYVVRPCFRGSTIISEEEE